MLVALLGKLCLAEEATHKAMSLTENIQAHLDSIAEWEFVPEESLVLSRLVDEFESSGALTKRQAYFLHMSLGITDGILAKIQDGAE